VTDAASLHFNFDEWARQDEFGPDGSQGDGKTGDPDQPEAAPECVSRGSSRRRKGRDRQDPAGGTAESATRTNAACFDRHDHEHLRRGDDYTKGEANSKVVRMVLGA
jgi:hypothetical protein